MYGVPFIQSIWTTRIIRTCCKYKLTLFISPFLDVMSFFHNHQIKNFSKMVVIEKCIFLKSGSVKTLLKRWSFKLDWITVADRQPSCIYCVWVLRFSSFNLANLLVQIEIISANYIPYFFNNSICLDSCKNTFQYFNC